MSAKKYKVGAEIEAWCTKCKMDRLHAIESLKSDGNINRTICRHCESSHLFRRPKGDGTKPATRRKKDELVLTEEEVSGAKPYDMESLFEDGDVVAHVKFGNGRVLSVRPEGRMDIQFESGTKLLVCKDGGPTLLGKRSASKSKAKAKTQAKAAAAAAAVEAAKEIK